jgi:hypothetical protein
LVLISHVTSVAAVSVKATRERRPRRDINQEIDAGDEASDDRVRARDECVTPGLH